MVVTNMKGTEMKRMQTMAAGLLVLAGAVASPLAIAHATLKNSQPIANAVLEKAPPDIQLTFNEKVEAAFSSIVVQDGGGKDIEAGKAQVDAANPVLLKLDLPALGTGSYSVRWVAVGPDGHRRSGQFGFTVK
jgi:methionine-rich copper-binding protein CopC